MFSLSPYSVSSSSIISNVFRSLFGSVSAATAGSQVSAENKKQGRKLEWGVGKVHWTSLSKGKRRAAKEGRPLMLVITGTHGNTMDKRLSETFSNSKDILELSQSMVMVQVDRSNMPDLRGFTPLSAEDANFTACLPRIMFFDPTGEPMPNIKAKPKGPFIYTYTGEENVVTNMRKVKGMYHVFPTDVKEQAIAAPPITKL